jgi:hypothetical protein
MGKLIFEQAIGSLFLDDNFLLVIDIRLFKMKNHKPASKRKFHYAPTSILIDQNHL